MQKSTREELISFLGRTPLLGELSSEHLEMVADLVEEKNYAAGDVLYSAGDRADRIYFLESGLVKLSLISTRTERELYRLQSGDYCGLYSILGDGNFPEQATAILDAHIFELKKEDFYNLLEKLPDLWAIASKHVSLNIQGMLRGFSTTRARVQTSNMVVIMMEDDAYEDGHFAGSLMAELFRWQTGKSLLIYSREYAAWPSMPENDLERLRADDLRSELIFHQGEKSIRAIHWPGIEELDDIDDVDHVSLWLRGESKKYNTVFLLTAPGTKSFRTFSMGICRKSVTLVKDKIPEIVAFLKPARDRAYLVASGTRAGDLARHEKMLAMNPNNSLCFAGHVIRTDKSPGEIARWLVGKSIGMAFGGGGARAMAQHGILEVLHDAGLIIDAVAGSSAGCITAALFATGHSPRQMNEIYEHHLIRARTHPFSDYRLPFFASSLIKGKKAERMLKKILGDTHTLETKIGYLPMCTNMHDGAPYVPRNDVLWRTILASGAAPGMLPLVKDGKALLGDGGLVNNVPASALKDYGCDFVISANISIDPARSTFNAKSIIGSILRGIDIMMDKTVADHLEYTDFELKPDVDSFGVVDYARGHELIELGREHMRKHLDELLRELERLDIKPAADQA